MPFCIALSSYSYFLRTVLFFVLAIFSKCVIIYVSVFLGGLMYWDRIAGIYDLFENVYNGKVFNETGKIVAKYVKKDDTVLECACGTGAISVCIAPECKKLISTDFSKKMLRQAEKKCSGFCNVSFRRADMTALKCSDDRFDVVVAGNVLHLLDDPYKALDELERVCRDGGRLILPTYINMSKGSSRFVAGVVNKMGADFKRQFDLFSYKAFIEAKGYDDTVFELADGKMPCAIAVITIHKNERKTNNG